VKLWLVVVADKELLGEPDIGMAVVEGNQEAAIGVLREMKQKCADAGRHRCVGRVREIERSKHYRVLALVTPARLDDGLELTMELTPNDAPMSKSG